MAHWLDNLALQVAADETPRRTALRRVGAGVAGAIGLLLLGGSRASAWSDSGGHEENDEEEKRREKETCDNGLKRCGAICAVISIDPDNCGDCGTRCAPGQVCRGGQCKTECPPSSCNMMQCPAGQPACVSATGMSTCCAPGQSCVNGTCQASCAPPLTNCNGMCLDTHGMDPNNCGGCGTVCNTGQICQMGVCRCPVGNVCNGMCVDTQGDPRNCGTCGTVCSFANATSACLNGVCVIATCDPGFGNCDGNAANGCETPLNTNQNCGACGHTCGACETCSNGMCIPAANGTVCGSGQICFNGTCGCPMGFTQCGSTCVNLQVDPRNCGMCGNACASGCCTLGMCPTSCA